MTAIAVISFAIVSCTAAPELSKVQGGRTVSTLDATSAWNSVCATYNFVTKPSDSSITFARGYSGSNFATDFSAAAAAVNQILGSVWNPMNPESATMKTTIENWGPAGGGM